MELHVSLSLKLIIFGPDGSGDSTCVLLCAVFFTGIFSVDFDFFNELFDGFAADADD